MSVATAPQARHGSGAGTERVALHVLGAISLSHLLNDLIQAVVPAIYPVLKRDFRLDFAQIGLITFCFYAVSSLIQPLVGLYADRRPLPFSLAAGMGASLVGLLLLSTAWSYPVILAAAMLVGLGSAVFHPEASRVARMASGGRHGLAQSLFQVGGNAGTALGPLMAALVVVPRGQGGVAWFSLAALAAIVVLALVGRWYGAQVARARAGAAAPSRASPPGRRQLVLALLVLGVLIFSKFFYTTSISTYYAFFLMDRFGVPVQQAQFFLFLYLAAVAAGTIAGGPLGDRFGRKPVIWFSILGAAPFTLALPWASLAWTPALTMIIGFIMASAFPAIVVYAQELLPGRVGMISGLFFGFAFGMGGLGAALLGQLADAAGIATVYRICAFLPLAGLLAWFLPSGRRGAGARA
ncbi:MFS transporter [Camelimonas abortus]|uniref:MFS transporter n=1 Tax=Camelimonas abortus TaxID=1017184 RepID=A0ABV7LHM9_9HYPH